MNLKVIDSETEVIGIVIVWYNPTESQKQNLLPLSRCNNLCICVVDNSASYEQAAYEKLAEQGITYVHNANAGGIAGAFNCGVKYLSRNSAVKVFFTMDQDSELTQEFFVNMYQFMCDNKAELACPNFFDRNAKTYGTFLTLTPFFYKITNDGITEFCISSGLGISRYAWELLGPFNESLIIDHVDTDFCLRAYEYNITIKVNYGQCLNHAIGERSNHKLLGITIKPNHHSYVRKYYIARNGTYLAIKYFGMAKGYFNLNILRLVHEIISVLLYEKDKKRKLWYMIKGIFHGIKGELGAIKK
ncbi:MAG: glycosyltransferase [Plesiomonas shigelloides]